MSIYHYPRIRALRLGAGMNQKELAKLLSTTQQQYSRYEKGQREIPVHHLITLARFYHTTTDYLLSLED